MLNHIRLASEEEIKSLVQGSDLELPFTVLALNGYSEKPNFAVIKQVIEIDPIYFAPDANNNEKARFVWGLEERLQGAGVKVYYFNITTLDEQWQKVVQTWGAERVSKTSEIRFKKVLS